MSWRRYWSELLARERAHTGAIQHDGAGGGRVHAAEHVQKRRLASPGRVPMMTTNSPCSMVKLMSHGGHFHLAHLVDLAHVGNSTKAKIPSQHPAPRGRFSLGP